MFSFYILVTRMQKLVTQKHSLWNIVSQHHYSINPPYFPLHFLESRSVFAWMIMTNACLNLVIEMVIIMVIWSYGFQDFFSSPKINNISPINIVQISLFKWMNVCWARRSSNLLFDIVQTSWSSTNIH